MKTGSKRGSRRRRIGVLAALLGPCFTAVAVAAPTGVGGPFGVATAAALEWGFGGSEFRSTSERFRAHWYDRAVEARASYVRLAVPWRAIAPTVLPPVFDPRDPADPAYDWANAGTLDGAVYDAAARGIEPVLVVTGAPDWAEGPDRRPRAAPGTWKPLPGALADFATALARRYSGSFRIGAFTLPHVRYYQAWNEPNLATFLTPQWTGAKRNRPASPYVYRPLLGAFFDAVKAVDPSNVVLTAATAPTGDRAGAKRMRPLLFWRRLLCLRRRDAGTACPEPARFDVAAHNTIGAGPRVPAEHRGDVAIPNMGRIRRLLGTAARRGSLAPSGRKPLWVTEFLWDTNPPDSFGIPLRRQARWIAEAMHRFWRQGVAVALLLQIRDAPPRGPAPSGYADTLQTGVFFEDGTPKPAFDAVRFPFYAERQGRGARVWGIPPATGPVVIERRGAGGWRQVGVVEVAAGEAFTASVAGLATRSFRAVSGGIASLPWRVRR